MIKNALTIDVEDFSHSRVQHAKNTAFDEALIRDSVNEIITLLESTKNKATFFVLGVIAEKMPDLIKLICAKGHEIASHGYHHRPLYRLTPDEFRMDLLNSLHAIENAAGCRVLGFRAPYWSITKESLWALDILKECGLRYDSSISPAVTFLYGIKGASRTAYRHESGLLEVPPTTVSCAGKKIIIGGGFYLRALPLWFTRRYIEKLNRLSHYAVVYFHPHEMLDYRGAQTLSCRENFILNFGKATFTRKVRALIGRFQFTSLREILGFEPSLPL